MPYWKDGYPVVNSNTWVEPSGSYIIPGIQDVIDKGGTPDVYKCECFSCHRKMLELADSCPSCGSVDVDYTEEYYEINVRGASASPSAPPSEPHYFLNEQNTIGLSFSASPSVSEGDYGECD